MSRKRITYQSESLYVGSTGQYNPTQLHRIQSVSNSVDIQYVDINEMGKLASLSKEIVESPVTNLDFNYFLVDGHNEQEMGFSIAPTGGNRVNFLSGFFADSDNEEKNYYLLTVEEGKDAHQSTFDQTNLNNGIIGIGNGFITSYSIEAAVGSIPSADVSVEASNLSFQTGNKHFNSPAINTEDGTALSMTHAIGQTINLINYPVSSTGSLSDFILRPGDVVVDFDTPALDQGGALLPGMNYSDPNSLNRESIACVQSVSIDIPLSRTPMLCLTHFHPKTRHLDFPITATLSVNANLADISSGSLNDIICNPQTRRDISITLNNKCKNGV